MPDPVLRVTATAICSADLHLYRGKVPGLEAGDLLGHEFMGVVEDVGSAVAFDKGLQFRMGQTHVQRFMPELLEPIGNRTLTPQGPQAP